MAGHRCCPHRIIISSSRLCSAAIIPFQRLFSRPDPTVVAAPASGGATTVPPRQAAALTLQGFRPTSWGRPTHGLRPFCMVTAFMRVNNGKGNKKLLSPFKFSQKLSYFQHFGVIFTSKRHTFALPALLFITSGATDGAGRACQAQWRAGHAPQGECPCNVVPACPVRHLSCFFTTRL